MFVPITVKPGVVKVDSDYAATGRWIDMDKVRFVRGLPQKVGGVQKLHDEDFSGIARGAHAWNTFTGAQCLMFGTACHLYLLREGTLSEVTPYRTDANGISLTDPFTTTNGSAVVTVADTAHGIAAAGTGVTFSGASAVGGITIDGDYTVTEVLDANSFTITHSEEATSDATGGGAVTAYYELNCGDTDPAYLLGWGVGGWGNGFWGTDASLAEAVISEPTVWALDSYGEDLVVNPLGGGIYIYDSSTGVTRPSLLANAPTVCRYAFVTPERYIMALGCTTLAGAQDTMTVRWPDIEDNTDWTPATTNTANQRKLQGGTRLVAGTGMTDGISLVWSDSSVFLFQFTGSIDEVYASRQIATHCGLVAPHAFAKTTGMAFWMGSGNFWMYSGFVQPIPNAEDIRAWVFGNINLTHLFKAFAFYNPLFNEVWFVYPSASSTEPDSYVMVDLDDYAWSHGTWERTAAAQFWTGERRPVLLGTDGYIYLHDSAGSPDEDGAAMPWHIELAPTDIQGGNVLVDIFGFIPDFQRQSGDMTLYVYGKDHPRDSEVMTDTVIVAPTDKLVDLRVSGRQFGMKISSDAQGSDFRLGKWGLEISGAGKKRGSQP
jgi:hypothetical protein